MLFMLLLLRAWTIVTRCYSAFLTGLLGVFKRLQQSACLATGARRRENDHAHSEAHSLPATARAY